MEGTNLRRKSPCFEQDFDYDDIEMRYPNPRDGPQSDNSSEFYYTYHRVFQAADLLDYDKRPQSTTRKDFMPKKLDAGDTECLTIHQKIQKFASRSKPGKKPPQMINYDLSLVQSSECANSSFKRVMQRTKNKETETKPHSISRTDYQPKPLNVDGYSAEFNTKQKYQEETTADFSRLLNSVEMTVPEKKPKGPMIDYEKDVQDETSTFLRVMQAANYNRPDPDLMTIAMKDFRDRDQGTFWAGKAPLLNDVEDAKFSQEKFCDLLGHLKHMKISK